MEIVVALGVSGVMTIGMVGAVTFFQEQTSVLEDKLDASIEGQVADKILWKDLSSAFPSFNNIRIYDNSQRNFFEYTSDFPDIKLNNATKSRELTLRLGENSQLVMFLQNDKKAPPVIYEPVKAYKVEEPANAGVRGNISYKGINFNGYMDDLIGDSWRDGGIVALYTPVSIRTSVGDKEDAGGYVPSRWPYYIGVVSGGDLINMTISGSIGNQMSGGIITNKNPRTGMPYEGAQDYFENLPAVGGAAPVVLVRTIDMVEYAMEKAKVNNKDTGQLVRRIWRNGEFQGELIVASAVKEVHFRRPSIAQAVISVEIIADLIEEKPDNLEEVGE